jgi:hypothetical protein
MSVKGNIENNSLTTKVEEENKKNSLAVKFTFYTYITQTHKHKYRDRSEILVPHRCREMFITNQRHRKRLSPAVT